MAHQTRPTTAALLAIAAITLGSPAQAQPAPDTDAGRCAALLESIGDILPFKTAPTLTASGPNTCTLGYARLDLMPLFGLEVDEVLVQGFTPPPGAVPPGGKIERRIELRDARQTTSIARPGIRWLQHVTQTPMLLVLASTEDTAARTMTLSLDVSGRNYGDASLAIALEGVGPDNGPFGLPDIQAAALNQVSLHWDSRLLLLRFAVPALAGTLGDDPEQEVEADKQRAEREMRSALAEFPGVEPGAPDALAAFIHDFPRPTKVLDVTIDLSSHPLGAADADTVANGTDRAIALARQYKLKATYGGTAD